MTHLRVCKACNHGHWVYRLRDGDDLKAFACQRHGWNATTILVPIP